MDQLTHVFQLPDKPSSSWKGQVRFPRNSERLSQTEEWCEVRESGSWKRVRFHDYDEIYRHPGLYEYLFYQEMKCQSPERVVHLLGETCSELKVKKSELRVIELGAGNGIVGEYLRSYGAGYVLGIDIIEEAKVAAERDRPMVYDDYLVADLSQLSPETKSSIEAANPTCLVCVAALGFGDIPPKAYYNALSFIPSGGLLAFNIKADFLKPSYHHGFSELIRRMNETEIIRIEALQRYRHRINVNGEPLFYTAMVATKLRPVPESMLVQRS